MQLIQIDAFTDSLLSLASLGTKLLQAHGKSMEIARMQEYAVPFGRIVRFLMETEAAVEPLAHRNYDWHVRHSETRKITTTPGIGHKQKHRKQMTVFAFQMLIHNKNS